MTQTPSITPPPLDDALLRQVAPGENLLDRWIARATFHSFTIHRCQDTAASVAAALDAALAGKRVTRTLLNAHELEARYALPTYLQNRPSEILPWGAAHCARDSYTCELALTDCHAALADTGALVVWSDVTFGRSSTLVIPIHIVLLPASRILPDLVDGLAFLQRQFPQTLPSNVVLINGPSKTADIEMNLITGVHGPKHLMVLLIEQPHPQK